MVADPYHFDTDPDPGCEKICYESGSGSRVNFDTDHGMKHAHINVLWVYTTLQSLVYE